MAQRPNIAYIDPKTNKVPEFTRIKVNDANECLNFLDKNIKQGERHLLGFTWLRKSWENKDIGHVVIAAKNSNNEIEIYDPQNGLIYDKEFLNNIKYTYRWTEEPFYPKILRVDDKELNYDILKRITRPARKKLK